MEQPPMNNSLKIIAWNVNGVRAVANKNPNEMKRLIKDNDPDIVIWNEIKGNESMQVATQKLMDETIPGFKWYWNNSERPGYAGVCISIKPHINVLSVDYGLNSVKKESEGRILTIELEKCYVVGVYVVNAGEKDLKRLQYKLEWMANLALHLDDLKQKSPHKAVILMGDLNIAPMNVDIHNPKRNQKSAGFTQEERDCFEWFKQRGWVDVYRSKYPNSVEYTYFSIKARAKERNAGWRIDLTILDQASYNKIGVQNIDSRILGDYNASDHCPILLDILL